MSSAIPKTFHMLLTNSSIFCNVSHAGCWIIYLSSGMYLMLDLLQMVVLCINICQTDMKILLMICHLVLNYDTPSLHLFILGISCLLTLVEYNLALVLWMGLISTLLGLVGSGYRFTLPFALGTNMKLLHHLDVSSMPSATITYCICSLPSSSFRGSCKACASLLWGAWYGWLPSLTCTPSSYSLWTLFLSIALAILSATLFVLDLKQSGMFTV